MKTLPYLLLSLLLSSFLLIGCGSENDDYISKYCPGSCTVIKGRLTTADGTRPLAHVPMLVEWQSDGYIVSGPVRKKAVAKTDEDGNYELRFLIRDDEFVEGYFAVEPTLDVAKYAYCSNGEISFSFSELTRDTTIIADYDIPEKAFIEFKLSNPDALQAGDKFTTRFTYSFGKDGQQLCGSDVQWLHTYKNNQIVEVAADQPLFLEQIRLKNGIETKEQITLQLQPGETKEMSINF